MALQHKQETLSMITYLKVSIALPLLANKEDDFSQQENSLTLSSLSFQCGQQWFVINISKYYYSIDVLSSSKTHR